MIKLFKKVASWFGYVDKDEIPQIRLATSYALQTNTHPHDISDYILKDIKDQTYSRLKEDIKLLKRVNDFGLIGVEFTVRVPIGISTEIRHTFYWDGDTLYSMTKESKEMTRASAIDSILS